MGNIKKFESWVSQPHERNLLEIKHLVTNKVIAEIQGNAVYDLRGMVDTC